MLSKKLLSIFNMSSRYREVELKASITCLNKNNSKRAYQLVIVLSRRNRVGPQLSRTSLGSLTEEQEILSRWTEYCSILYTNESCGDNAILDCSQPPENLHPTLLEEAEIAVASLNKSTACGCQCSAVAAFRKF